MYVNLIINKVNSSQRLGTCCDLEDEIYRNSEYEEDIRSVVIVYDWGNWTGEELGVLDKLAEKLNLKYRKQLKVLLGANYLFLEKSDEGNYRYKFLTWESVKYTDNLESLVERISVARGIE